jgi:hypothetical protein
LARTAAASGSACDRVATSATGQAACRGEAAEATVVGMAGALVAMGKAAAATATATGAANQADVDRAIVADGRPGGEKDGAAAPIAALERIRVMAAVPDAAGTTVGVDGACEAQSPLGKDC